MAATGIPGQSSVKRGPLADLEAHLSQRATPEEHVSRNVNDLQDEQLHTKLDPLREAEWKELVEMQRRQITMLKKQIGLLEGLYERRPSRDC
jgi:hypothetical protein